MKKLLLFVLLAVLASCGGKYKYESVEGDPMGARIYTLDNGLKVYMAVNKEEPRIQTYIAVRVGGKNDPAETTGLAHYFEHLMFKGTPSFGTQDYEAEKPLLDQIEGLFETYRVTTDEAERKALYAQIDSLSYVASGYAIPNEYDKLMAAIGAQGTNAYTSYDVTAYVENIPANQVENWLKVEADRFKTPILRGFHTELETIYEEKNMSLTSDPRKVLETTLSDLFPTHPYGTQTVLGTQEHLKNPSITNVKNYHTTWYVPNNMAICMSGDFDPDTTIKLIDKYFGDMVPNNDLPAAVGGELPAINEPITSEVLGLDAENVTLAWRVGGGASTDYDVMNVLSSVLYNGQAGLIDLDLVQQQKVLSAYAFYYEFADHGMLFMQGRPKAGQTLDEVRDLMMAEVNKIKAGDFSEELVTAVVNNRKAEIQSYLDSNYGRADMFVNAFVNGISWERAVGELKRLGTINKQEVMAFANAKFLHNNYAVVYKRQGKDPNELKMEKPALTPIQTNRDAVSAYVTEIQNTVVTPIEPVWVDFNTALDKLKAKSDIEVLYKKNETTGLYDLTYVYETGAANDPALSLAASYMEYLGTNDMTAQQLASEFYNIASSFRIQVGEDRTEIHISGLAENMGRAMELTENLMAGAVADEAVLAGLKADLLKSRADAKLNQAQNFARLRTYVTRGPEYIDAVTLSNAELAALTSEELLGKIRSLADLQHRVLYYGPATHDDLLADLAAHHKVADTPIVPDKGNLVPMVLTPSNSVVMAEYDAAQIYYIQYSNRGEAYDAAMEPSMYMYNTYFSGNMSAIVFQEMREARGLAYSASANITYRPARKEIPYTFNAFIATQNDKMRDAAEAFDDIINNMPESEAAFKIAKESIISEIRTDRVVKYNVLWFYLAAEDFGIDYDRRKPIYEQVQGMTLADVKAFQQEWIAGRPYTFGILGRSADLDTEYLRTLGPVRKVSQTEIFGY